MFNIFKKKAPEFEFYTTIPGLAHVFPIVPTRRVKMPWLAESQSRFRAIMNSNRNSPAVKSTASHMCSGIGELAQAGWVLTTWHDIEITTNGDGRMFEWKIPPMNRTLHFSHISSFDPDLFGDFVDFPPQSLKTLVKINTPWHVRAPRGWGLLMIPLQYHNETRFSGCTGIIDPELSSILNGLLFWHVLNDRVLLPAGTPLCQIIPIRLGSTPEFLCRDAGPQELAQIDLDLTVRQGSWTNSNRRAREVYRSFFGVKK